MCPTHLSNSPVVPARRVRRRAGQASTSKEPALGRERDDPVVVVYTDDEPPEPILAIEGGPQSELVSAPFQVDGNALLEVNHPGSWT